MKPRNNTINLILKNGLLSKRGPLFIFDLLGITASGLCLIHCAVMPFILMLLPAMSLSEKIMHPLLGGLAFLSASLFFMHNRKRKPGVFIWIFLSAGNIIIILTAFFLHDLLHSYEIILNTFGSTLLIIAHYQNYRHCKSC